MSLRDDVRAVSENALEQLAARFSDLPRPLLVAIGAGDMAVARFAELTQALTDSLADRVDVPSVDVSQVRAAVAGLPARAQKMAAEGPAKAQRLASEGPAKAQRVAAEVPAKAQQAAADLPAKAQRVVVDLASSIERFASDGPARAQALIAQLPDRLAEVQTAARSLSPDMFRETVDAYGRLAGIIYGSLADRGSQSWTNVRSGGFRTGAVDGRLPQAAHEPPAPTTTAAARAAAASSARASAAAARAAAATRATTQDPAPHAEPVPGEPPKAASPKGQSAHSAVAHDAESTDVKHAGRKREARTHARTVTTPDGTAHVTVAPKDVVPKGAHVKPPVRKGRTSPPAGPTPEHDPGRTAGADHPADPGGAADPDGTAVDPGTTADPGNPPVGI